MSERKERTRHALAERYYGKKDILQSWEERSLIAKNGERVERDYIYNLRRRVRGYQNDLAYRGADGFTEHANNGSASHAADL